MATIRITEAEAIRDIARLLTRAYLGEEIVIETDAGSAPVVLRKAAPLRRSVPESIALAEARTQELGYKPVMDAEFAADLEETIPQPQAAR